MASIDTLAGKRVFKMQQPRGKKTDDQPQLKRVGKVHNVVFAPDALRVVGAMVKQPDIAGMVKRPDLFVALDSLEPYEKGVLLADDAVFDQEAAARLGVDLDACFVWMGMDVVCQDGTELGYVVDANFDLHTGEVSELLVADGSAAAALVGAVPITAELARGYANNKLMVANEAKKAALSGGVMAKAGEGFGKAKQKGSELAQKAGSAAGDALDKGSFALGKALGSAKRAVREATAESGEAGELQAPAAKPTAPKPPLYAPTGEVYEVEASVKPAAQKQGTNKPKKSGPSTSEKAARAVGKQIGRTQGMFGAFLKEFKDASK